MVNRMNVTRLCKWLAAGALALIATGSISQTTYAADSAPFNWSGVYVGLHMGYGWGAADTTLTPQPTADIFIVLAPQKQSPDPRGVLGGAQIGYNWQKGIFVIGGETDFSFSDMKGTTVIGPITQNNGTPFPGAGNNITVHQDTDWVGTVRLRVGVNPAPKVLLYGTGGLAYGRVNYSANTDFRPVGTEQYPASVTRTKMGWTAGAGAEFAINRNWSVKTEYLFYDLGSESATANPVIPFVPPEAFRIGYKWETAAHTGRIGLNFRF